MRYLGYVLGAALLAGCGLGDSSASGKTGAQDQAAVDRLRPVGTLPPGVAEESGERGREVYRQGCVMCHGEQGEGTQLGPALADASWSGGRTGAFEEIAAVVRDGTAAASDSFPVPMPARGDGTLTDADVQAVAAYTFSISRP